jgi:hypothetical protein
LPAALHKAVPPDLDVQGDAAGLGFIHRTLEGADIYFLANTSNQPIDARVRFRSGKRHIQVWNAEDGAVQDAWLDPSQRLSLKLEPYESRTFVLTSGSRPATPARVLASRPEPVTIENLSRDWTISFPGPHAFQGQLDSLVSWTSMPDHQYFSGEAVYSRSFTRAENPNPRLLLDFGDGRPIPDDRPAGADGMHALLDPPIREAAIVYLNGKRAGSLWHPPYRLDITEFIQPGENRLEIHVFNTAINELAGQPRRDMIALRAKYGNRFEPQDQDRIKPVPSGLLGPVRLLAAPLR